MRSSFLGFEIAKSGLQSAQAGLDVTGQNIAKMNAKGYSRQTVEQSTDYYATSNYKYALLNENKIGHGVTLDRITQIRDQFLDTRYREAFADYSRYSKALSIMTSVSNLVDETLRDGLGAAYEEFIINLQTFSMNTGDIDYSGLVRSSAQKITETLSYYYNQLEKLREQEVDDLSISINDINDLLERISGLNKEIQFEKLFKNSPNELLDTRNLCLDQLAGYMNITIEDNGDGTINVKVGSQYLIDARSDTVQKLSYEEIGDTYAVKTESGELEIANGSLKASLDAINGKGDFAASGENDAKGILYFQMLLDAFALNFATKMNELNGADKPLFQGTTALTIEISDAWLKDANYITTTNNAEPKDGQNDNILRMLAELNKDVSIGDIFIGTFDEFILKMILDAGSEESYMNDLTQSSDAILTSIDNQREAAKGVSLNEETVNILKYQRAFEASSRILTALDEMLDTIINRMGAVGR